MMVTRWKVITICRKSCSAFGKYSIKYEKGTRVKALPGTVGIFTFKSKSDASYFESCLPDWKRFLIVKVRPIGRQKRIKTVCQSCCDLAIDSFYETKGLTCKCLVDQRVAFYDEVEVLE